MPEKPAAERTELPTPRKLQKAREKGRVPQSQELMSIVALLVLVAMVALLAPSLLQWFIIQVRDGMSGENTVFAGSKSFLDFANRKTVDLILVICPILAALFAWSEVGCTDVGCVFIVDGCVSCVGAYGPGNEHSVYQFAIACRSGVINGSDIFATY